MNPTIRIRCAGILLKASEILLVRHEKAGRSYWLLPGGGVEYGESAETALKREFFEECGLTVQVGDLVLMHDSIPPDHHRQVLNLYFPVTTEEDQIRSKKEEVLREAKFHPLATLTSLVIYPRITSQLLEGIATKWVGGRRYLGNIWDE